MALQVTLRDIAKEAGVSASTACRALRGDPRISASTARAVRQVAGAMGYRPDPLLSALSFRRGSNGGRAAATTLAYISNDRRLLYENLDESMDTQAANYQEMCFRGAMARAERLGYRLERFRINRGGLNQKRLNQILRARGIVGVCLAPIGDVRRRAIELEWGRFSSASIGVSVREPALHRSSTHHFQGMSLALERLYALGYRRIGICLDEVTGHRVENMWLSSALLFGSSHPDTRLSIRLVPRLDKLEAPVCRWFAQEEPEVVIGSRQIYNWLERMNVAIPQQAGFVTLNWTEDYSRFAGIDQCTEQIAAAAVDLVVEQMHKCEYGIPQLQRTVLLKGIWRDGQTLIPRADQLQVSRADRPHILRSDRPQISRAGQLSAARASAAGRAVPAARSRKPSVKGRLDGISLETFMPEP